MLFYFIGIKGSGMAALAQILLDDGHQVRGVDTGDFVFTEKALSMKNVVIDNFDQAYFSDADFIIIGHSFIEHNLIKKIKESDIPCLEYHHFVAKYFDDKYQIAIAGTHGKTTSVGLMYSALKDIVKTSELRGDGTGVGGIDTTHLVFEACEYKNHFLAYMPQEAIITNIDYDHVDFFGTVEDYIEAFKKFASLTRRVYILEDDAHHLSHPHKVTFGLTSHADFFYERLDLSKGLEADVYAYGKFLIHIKLPIYGVYNSLHVLAIIAFVTCNKFDIGKALEGLANFGGVKRRLEHRIISDDVFIDDYAHHPAEIEASISSVRLMYPSLKVVAVFKPDRNSRLVKFKDELTTALLKADFSYVLPLYEHLDGNETSSNVLCNDQIKFIEKISDFIDEKNHENKTVYLFMSSKNLDDWIYGLHDFLHGFN